MAIERIGISKRTMYLTLLGVSLATGAATAKAPPPPPPTFPGIYQFYMDSGQIFQVGTRVVDCEGQIEQVGQTSQHFSYQPILCPGY
jgi:hypothetical protein